jgi:small-conductance mechanosensitive channel
MQSALVGLQDPLISLSAATILLVAIAIDASRDRRRALWLRLVARIGEFVVLTWLIRRAVGSPLMPELRVALPGESAWAQLIEVGWWIVGARVAVGIVRLVVVLENRPRETQIVSDLLAAAIYIATTLAVVNFVFGVPIVGLVATSGVVAIVLGLALQSTLSDVFSGIAVGLEHPYKLGDLLWVEGGIEGQVLQVNWRSTQIATPHNSVAIVPNSVIAKSRLENRSAPTPTRSITISISADAAVDPRRCMEALDAAVLASRVPLSSPTPTINCVGLQGDGIAYEIHVVVGTTGEIAAARTEVLSLVHRHLRHAGIALSVNGIATPPATVVPAIDSLLAESTIFGALAADERKLLAGHFTKITRAQGETLICEGELPEGLFLVAAGTVELTHGRDLSRRVLQRASPGDSVGISGLVTGTESLVTATALTPIVAYSLNTEAIAEVLRVCPTMASSLEARAKRGLEWLRCETMIENSGQMEKPDMLVARFRQFLGRLNA